MVSVWAHEYGISLGHISKRNQKSHGKKKTMESLIKKLNLTNKIVTLDTNGATSKIFNKFLDKKADAVIDLKGNQAGMMKLAIHMFDLKNEKIIKSRVRHQQKRNIILRHFHVSMIFQILYAITEGLKIIFIGH